MRLVAQVLLAQLVDGDADHVDLAVQIVLHDLLAAPRQLVEIHPADRTDRPVRVPARDHSHPDRADDEDDRKDRAADDRDRLRSAFSDILHEYRLLRDFGKLLRK